MTIKSDNECKAFSIKSAHTSCSRKSSDDGNGDDDNDDNDGL